MYDNCSLALSASNLTGNIVNASVYSCAGGINVSDMEPPGLRDNICGGGYGIRGGGAIAAAGGARIEIVGGSGARSQLFLELSSKGVYACCLAQ